LNREGCNFVDGHEIQFNGSLARSDRSQKCTRMSCEHILIVGQDLNWPDECMQVITKPFCGVSIGLTENLREISISFLEDQGDSNIGGTILSKAPEFLVESSFQYIPSSVSSGYHGWTYYCANGQDECDKKYVETNLKRLVEIFNGELLRSKLTPLLYRPASDAQQQCYISPSELTNCPNGLCHITTDESNIQKRSIPIPIKMKYSCEQDAGEDPAIKVHYQSFSALVGSKEYDGDYVWFDCNVNKCNGPTNIDNVKRIFRNEIDGGGQASSAVKNFFNFLAIAAAAWCCIWSFQ